jgi:hypothetical protein
MIFPEFLRFHFLETHLKFLIVQDRKMNSQIYPRLVDLHFANPGIKFFTFDPKFPLLNFDFAHEAEIV